jgi:methionine synthase II (cobalamin-independent)
MTFNEFKSITIGSFPHEDGEALCEKLVEMVDIPAWPQLSRVSYRENMYVQYSPPMPLIVENEEEEKVFFDTKADMAEGLAAFYQHYLDEDFEYFGLKREYAQGFYQMLEILKDVPGEWVKGHVTGPVSFGLTVVDQDLKPSLYFPDLSDATAKAMAMNARWQIQQMKKVREKTIVFVDEPYMAQFGSAFIALNREQAVGLFDQVFEAIQEEGGLAGVHCCANTDWSVLLESKAQILNLDAYEYMENLALYPAELRAFLDRGGMIAWGVVPTNEDVFKHSGAELAAHWEAGIENIIAKAEKRGVGFTMDDFRKNALISPACGLGSTTVEVADRALELIGEVTAALN